MTARVEALGAAAERSVPQSRWGEFARRLQQSKGAMIGLAILLVLVLSAVFAPLLTSFDPIRTDPVHALYSPGSPYIFGSDQYGRDIFSRVLYGARISLLI